MVRNIDNSTQIVLFLDDSSQRQSIGKTLTKKYSKEDKRMVRNIDDSTPIDSNQVELSCP